MRPARLLAGVASVALLASSGCTTDPAGDRPSRAGSDPASTLSPATESTAPAPPPAPQVGACYRLRFAEVARPSSRRDPVSCGARHTTQTIHVGRLDTLVEGHALAVDSDRAVRQVERRCPLRLATHLGGTPEARRLSRLQVVWFRPTLGQSDRGAAWFRCDVVALAAPDRLLPLPAPRQLEGILGDARRAAPYALCGTTDPGNPDFARVACALPHRWRAVTTITVPGRRYPGAAQVRAAGEETCRDEVRSRVDGALRFRYGWEWPTREQWRAGQRYGFCWAPD